MKVALITVDSREVSRNYSLPAPYFDSAPEALMQGFAAMPELEVHVISCTQKPVKSPEKIADNIFFHSIFIPKMGWMRTSYQGCVRAVRRKLKQIKPDIVHGQGTERECAISAAFSRFPNVITIHGNMAELARLFRTPLGTFNWLAAQLEDVTLKRARGVLCNSAYTESLVKPRAPKTWRVPNALRLPFFDAPAKNTASGKCVLLNVGVISERKRQVELLEVARRLREQGLNFEFQFIGPTCDDDYNKKFLDKIKEAEARGFARHFGTKSIAELISCFDAAHGVVHFPSEEAFGLVVPEALSRNLKLFGARVGGIPDIAGDISGAELFAADDWDGLAGALAKWIQASHPRPANSTAIIAERYHPNVIARRHLKIYREVLGS